MTEDEFGPEIVRLHRGFKQEELLTPERLKALFGELSHYPIGPVRDGITAALLENRMPGFERLAELIESAAEDDRRAESAAFDRESRRFLATEPIEPEPVANPSWAAAHHRAINLLIDHRKQDAIGELQRIGSPAADAIRHIPTQPLDRGAWLRANGRHWAAGLWPPNFCTQEELDHIGWPWPEWPKTHAELMELRTGIKTDIGKIHGRTDVSEADFTTGA